MRMNTLAMKKRMMRMLKTSKKAFNKLYIKSLELAKANTKLKKEN